MKIAVIGSGIMGAGIAQTLASRHDVIIRDIAPAALEKAMKGISKNLTRSVEKGKMSEEEKSAILGRIQTSVDLDDIKDSDLVIEAATENMMVKKEIFRTLDEVCEEKTILATNTSSLSITEIGTATARPHKVVGMHFFNPVPVMKLVEIIAGQLTEESVMETMLRITEEAGKTPVVVNEAPGFVVNRILVPMVNEAIGCFAEGVASAEHIDTAMKLGANHPIGPLALGDLIGLDICLAIMETLHREMGDKFIPHPLLRKMVRANQLGRKTGQGFFSYS